MGTGIKIGSRLAKLERRILEIQATGSHNLDEPITLAQAAKLIPSHKKRGHVNRSAVRGMAKRGWLKTRTVLGIQSTTRRWVNEFIENRKRLHDDAWRAARSNGGKRGGKLGWRKSAKPSLSLQEFIDEAENH